MGTLRAVIVSSFYAADLVLVVSGIGHVRHPKAASFALGRAGLPSRQTLVRVLGFAEFVLGMGVLVRPLRELAVGICVLYLAFAGFVLYLMARSDLQDLTCGCSQSLDSPPNAAHVLLDGAAAMSALYAALNQAPPITHVLDGVHGGPIVYLLAIGTLAWVSVLVASYFVPLATSYSAPPPREGHQHSTAEEALTRAGIPFDDPSLRPNAPEEPMGGEMGFLPALTHVSHSSNGGQK